MRSSSQLKIAVIGGGIAGAEVVRNALPRYLDITLIEPKSQIECQALYPEYLAGTAQLEDLTAPLRPFCDRMGAQLTNERAIRMEKNLVVCEKSQIEFDMAVIATGAAQNYFGIKGAERSFSVNSLSETEKAKRFLKKEEPKKIAIIGSGLTGIETACALKESIDADIHIIEAKSRVLPQFSENISSLINRALLEKGINILISARVKEIKEEGVVFFDGSTLDCEMAIWTAGIKPPDFVSNLAFQKKEREWIMTNPHLQASGNVFAIGDSAWVEIDGRVASKTAIEAEHQAAHMAHNLTRWAERKPLMSYNIVAPTDAQVALISMGCNSAVGVYGSICIAMPARLMHALKGWIDKSFIQRFK